MNTVKNVTVAIALSVLSVGYAQAAEAVKALAGRELPHDEGLWTVALWGLSHAPILLLPPAKSPAGMIRAGLHCVRPRRSGGERKI